MYDIASEQTVLNDGNNLTSQTTYGYQFASGLSQLIQKNEYDYGLSLLRKTVTAYQTFAATPVGGIIADKPCQNIVYDGSSNRLAETDYFYDGGSTSCGTAGTPSVTAASGLVAGTHDETNYGSTSTAPRANMTQQTRWSSAGTSPVTTYTYDETGQVLGITDPCGSSACADMVGTTHNMTYSYSDSYTILSGGQNVNYTPTGNTNAYLTKVTDALGHTATFTYDYSNGQLTASKDQNDITANRAGTTYVYNDPFARPKKASYPNGGQTTLSYDDTAPSPTVTTTKLIDSTSNTSATSIAVMDGAGRLVQTQLTSDPDGADYADVTFDGFGTVKTRSNPHRASGSTTDGTTGYTYDALGRTLRIVQPAGSDVDTIYSGNCTTTADETGVTRTLCSDALGRVIEVDEPGSGASRETPGSGTVTIGGSEQANTTPATHSTGTFTIVGATPFSGGATITLYVNGAIVATNTYGTGSTPQSVGSALTSSINGNTSNPVTATFNNNTVITVTSKAAGSSTNYTMSGTPTTYNYPNQTIYVGSTSGMLGGGKIARQFTTRAQSR
jgi:YD repeat-containing protein